MRRRNIFERIRKFRRRGWDTKYLRVEYICKMQKKLAIILGIILTFILNPAYAICGVVYFINYHLGISNLIMKWQNIISWPAHKIADHADRRYRESVIAFEKDYPNWRESNEDEFKDL